MNDVAKTQTSQGHPPGLYMLFFAEMWERFCFYGMRSLLTLYMVSEVFKYSDEQATGVYGSYNAMIYLTPIAGGIIADRLLGYRWAILLGGILMAIGQFTLVVQQEFFFYAGMAFMVVGNGLFKPNISTLVGRLYPEGDSRRDAGFTIFYIGINVGAFLSTLICGYYAKTEDWTVGFGIAGVGMLLGLVTFGVGKKNLEGHGEPPAPEALTGNLTKVLVGALALVPAVYLLLSEDAAVKSLLIAAVVIVLGSLIVTALREEKVIRERMFVLIVLWFFHMMFWMFFEQAGTSLTLFTARNIDLDIGGWEFPAAWGQFFNPLFILLFGAAFTMLWVRLGQRGRDPSIPTKFGLALIQLGLGFYVLVWAAAGVQDTGLVSIIVLIFCYLLHTTGELCISPVGLSAVTKLAPKRMTGMVMGAWFLSIAAAHKVAAMIAGETGAAGGENLGPTETLPIYTDVFWQITLFSVGSGVLIIVLGKLFLKRMLHGVS
ncbi:MAG: peptide MFS transporter [Planctomycetota bacterium]|nr:peptide MFS transporter [Planctomycetota bacterium]